MKHIILHFPANYTISQDYFNSQIEIAFTKEWADKTITSHETTNITFDQNQATSVAINTTFCKEDGARQDVLSEYQGQKIAITILYKQENPFIFTTKAQEYVEESEAKAAFHKATHNQYLKDKIIFDEEVHVFVNQAQELLHQQVKGKLKRSQMVDWNKIDIYQNLSIIHISESAYKKQSLAQHNTHQSPSSLPVGMK